MQIEFPLSHRLQLLLDAAKGPLARRFQFVNLRLEFVDRVGQGLYDGFDGSLALRQVTGHFDAHRFEGRARGFEKSLLIGTQRFGSQGLKGFADFSRRGLSRRKVDLCQLAGGL